MKDYYKVLEVSPDSDPATIKRAYKRLAKRCHPDVCPGGSERFRALREAYETLSDEKRRADYDRKRARQVPIERSEDAGVSGNPPETMHQPGVRFRRGPHRPAAAYPRGTRRRGPHPRREASSVPVEPLSPFSRSGGPRRGFGGPVSRHGYQDTPEASRHLDEPGEVVRIVCPRCGGRGRIGWLRCRLCQGRGTVLLFDNFPDSLLY